jgi:hypothetical protein
MGSMRQGLAAIAAFAVACLVPAGAAGAPAAPPRAAAVVAGVPVTMAQARARAGSKADTYDVRQTFADLVQARFVAGEAALRGLSTNPDYLARALAAEQSGWGGEAAWRTYLKSAGIAESESRAAIADQALGATLTDTITDAAHGDARAWGLAFHEVHARWRAQTTCSASIADRIPDWCGNEPARDGGCLWFGVGDGCALGVGNNVAFVRLADLFYPGKVFGTCEREGQRALTRLRAYLKRTAPGVLHRTSVDFGCRPQMFQTRRRADLVVVLHAIARIAAHVRRS